MAGVRDNTVSNVASGGIASFKSVGQVPLKSLKVNFNPIQEGDGDPSPSNVRAISGWTGLNVFRSESKNILDPFNNPIWNHNVYSVNQSGEITVTGSDGRGWTGTQISPLNLVKGTYTISYTGGGNCNLRTSIDDYETNYNTTNGHLTFTLTEDAGVKFKFSGKTYPATFYVQIEPGQTTHDYESYKPFTTVPVSWPDLGAVYGGYVDLISGEVWQGWQTVKIADLTWNNYSSKIHYYANITKNNVLPSRKPNSYIYSDTLTPKTNGSFIYENVGEFTYYGEDTTYASGYNNIWTKLPEAMDGADANAWIKSTYPDAEICYKLAEPVLIGTIDPITIKTLIGTNNIWSNADTVEAQYCALESLDIYKQRFKSNEPHLQSASGNITSFQTDMVAPLKECKVYFEPVQASGTPSPDNVLPISGWDGLTIQRSGKNLYNPTLYPIIPNIWVHGGDGSRSLNASDYDYVDYIPIPTCFIGKIITLNKNPGGANPGFAFYSNNINTDRRNAFVGGVRNYGKAVGTSLSATIPQGAKYMSFTVHHGDTNIQLELGSGMTSYEPYNGSTTSITLPSTYYGGYCNPFTGEGMITYKYLHLTGNENWYMEVNSSTISNASYLASIRVEPTGQNSGVYKPAISDKLAPSTYWAPNLYCAVINTTSRVVIGLPQELSTKEAVNNWIQSIGGIDIVWESMFPTSFTFTPVNPIKTLKNQNNIWSNTNGITQVKYWTHGSIADKRKVVWNQYSPQLISDNWKSQNTNYTSLNFDNNILTITITQDVVGVYQSAAVTVKQNYPWISGHKYYIKQQINPSEASSYALIKNNDWAGSYYCSANTWTTIRNISSYTKTTSSNVIYIGYCANTSQSTVGKTTKIRNPMIIDLTQMFGQGNEPSTREEFEELCARNKVDLTQYHPQNTTGTEMYWYF